MILTNSFSTVVFMVNATFLCYVALTWFWPIITNVNAFYFVV